MRLKFVERDVHSPRDVPLDVFLRWPYVDHCHQAVASAVQKIHGRNRLALVVLGTALEHLGDTAGADSAVAVGLAIIVALYRARQTIDVADLTSMRG